MTDIVTIGRLDDGISVIAPEGAPTVLDRAAGIDVMVLEVYGGHLSWSVLAGQMVPAAVIDDLDLAQEWIWAVYGEPAALAVADFDGATVELTAEPALPQLVANAWRLGFAQWAARWWPTSTIDAIAPLDERLLEDEIATLAEECELLVDGDDAVVPNQARLTVDISARADDYALAAGAGADAPRGALVLARGTGGWDWRRCPPGLIDASERAVSWELIRDSGVTYIRVTAVAAPQLGPTVPPHLRPYARVDAPTGVVEAELHLDGDTWKGQATSPSESVLAVDIFVPGVGMPGPEELGGPEIRQQVRDLATSRLRRAMSTDDNAADAPLLAEIAAAASDSDF
jgi:hypothetical protein